MTTLNAVARALRDELGMTVVVHHHAGTFVETPEEIDRLLAETDPATGGPPARHRPRRLRRRRTRWSVLARHGGRVRYVHLKDVRADELARVRNTGISMAEAWKRGVFCPLGEGVVDFPACGVPAREGYAAG